MGNEGKEDKSGGSQKVKQLEFTGLREVRVIQVIQTLYTERDNLEPEHVRCVYQYWTLEGECITGSEIQKKYDRLAWLERCIANYEKKAGEGKMKDFMDYVSQFVGAAD